MHMLRRAFAGLLLCLIAASGFAQPYPAKPIRLVIPWPAGGPTDILGRVFAERLARVLGQPLVVDNRGGASGAVGADLLADPAARGSTPMVQRLTHPGKPPFP